MSVSGWTKTSAGEVRTASYCDDCVAAHPWVVMYGPILPTDDPRCDGCERVAAGPLNHVTMDWRLPFSVGVE